MVARPTIRVLSSSQFETLAEHGEERSAEVGETLFRIGDPTPSFIAIREGEAAIRDGADNEVVRIGESSFIGEMSLLTGQSAFLTAVVTEPMRYIEVSREELRGLLFEDTSLSDLLLPAFIERREILQQREGIGVEIIGPADSQPTRELVDFVRRLRLPSTWVRPEQSDQAAVALQLLDPGEIPLVRLPGGRELRAPSHGELSRALGIGLELKQSEEVDLLILGGGPGGLGAAVYAASEGLETLIVERTTLGGQAGTSRRIENYLGFPAGISGNELTSRAVSQARKFGARTATPYSARALEADGDRHVVRLEEGNEIAARAVLLSTGAEYRRLPVEGLEDYEGITVFYAAGPPEGHLCAGQRVGVVGGGNSAGQAAVWLARGGALVTLLHRRADLAETMSAYLIRELDRNGVAVRDHSEIAALHGEGGRLESVTLTDGAEMPLSFLFLFLGATPCTDWLGEQVARDEHGFLLTGPEAGAQGLLETSVPGVYAAGDVRSGSIKRCATAVGEGATVVQFAHERMT